MTNMIKRVLVGTVATTALLGGAAAVFPASADAGTRVTSAGNQEGPGATGFIHWGCTINADNVNFRDENGTALGQVNRGQKMNVYPGHQGMWVGGHLWGDDRYVYVHWAYVDC